MNIVIMEPLGISNEILDTLTNDLKKNHTLISYNSKTTLESELINRAKDADIIVISNNPLSKNVISKLTKLKMISVAFVGIDHIDIDICKEKNIRISNAADYCTNAVAELTIGLTLSVLRKIPQCDIATRKFSSRNTLIGNELYKKTFGIIGTGKIGLKTAEIAKVFGCNVIAYSRTKKEVLTKMGIEFVSLDTLMSKSDIISIHIPLTDHTNNLIDKEKLDLMKSSSIIINTARGPIIDNTYLTELLNNNKIAGAGIDVFDIEPPLNNNIPFPNNNNSVLTPHVAFYTEESILRRASIVIENIQKWINNNPQNIML